MSPLPRAARAFAARASRWVAPWCGGTAIIFVTLALTFGVAHSRAAQQPSLSEDLARTYEAMARDDPTVVASLRERVKTARAAGDKRGILAAQRDLALLIGDQDTSYGDIIALANELKDDETATLLTAARGRDLVWEGDLSGELMARRALNHAEANDLRAVLPYIYAANGKLQVRLSRIGEAVELLRRSYQAFVATKNRVCIAFTLVDMASALRTDSATSEDLAMAESYLAEARHLADARSEPGLMVNILQSSVLSAQRQGNMQAALGYLDTLRALITAGVRSSEAGWLEQQTGSVLLATGRPREALAAFQRALPLLEKENDSLQQSFSLLGLAEARSILGDNDDAQRALARAKQIVEKLGVARLSAKYHATAAGIAARNANYRLAYEETKAMAEKQQAAVQANNRQQLESQKVRFDVARKDAENALLRAQQLEADGRRERLVMTMVLAGVVLIGIVAFLLLQIRQTRRFAKLALRDELTGAPNRRRMLGLLRRESQPLLLGGSTMIAILDIDHFKLVNDRFGHDVGDSLLRAFYETCKSCLRGSDVLGRWGGEEFLIVGNGSPEPDISTLFRRILNAVQQIQVPGLPPDYRLTFSMGVSHLEPGGTGVEAALKMADTALYKAKKAGRSRCMILPENSGHPIKRHGLAQALPG
jgi:diguanylate cyclase (GGDEF)-like protein